MTESQFMDQRSSTAQLHDLTLLISNNFIDVNIGNTPNLQFQADYGTMIVFCVAALQGQQAGALPWGVLHRALEA